MGTSPRIFYRKYIKPCKKLREVELPNRVDEKKIRIEGTLFSNEWRLYYWKNKYIQCRSELEARYLQVWLKYGLTHIEIPKDEKYLAEILPILEKVEKRVCEIAEEKLAGYREDTQKDIISGVWLKIYDSEECEYKVTKKKNNSKNV
jgi:hypothetical protein